MDRIHIIEPMMAHTIKIFPKNRCPHFEHEVVVALVGVPQFGHFFRIGISNPAPPYHSCQINKCH
jgi:hypothetical protein